MPFITAEQVAERSWVEIPDSRIGWLENQIADAEDLLITEIPRLGDESSLSDQDRKNAARAISNAVLRLASNPTGIKREAVQDQSLERFGSEDTAGSLYFTEKELSWFSASTTRRRVGMLGVAPPKIAQV